MAIRIFPLLLSFAVALPAPAQDAPEWARQSVSSSRIRIFVRGDDCGGSHASNLALSQALDAGVLGWASVLVVGPWINDAVRALEHHPNASVGLHLSLTSEWDQFRWRPILSAAEVPSLVAPDGGFFKNYWLNSRSTQQQLATLERQARVRFARIMAAQLPAAREAEAELRAQVERAKRLGLRIEYIDCHMGVACLPELRPIMFKLAKELCVPIPEHGWMGHQEVGFRIQDDPRATIQYVYVADVDSAVERAVAHGARVLTPARDQFWGDRTARVIDPSGHVWVVASRIEETTEAQRAARWSSIRENEGTS